MATKKKLKVKTVKAWGIIQKYGKLEICNHACFLIFERKWYTKESMEVWAGLGFKVVPVTITYNP